MTADANTDSTSPRWLRRLLSLRSKVKTSPKLEQRLLIVALIVFVGATIAGLIALPPIDGGINWPPLVALALIGYPLMVLGMAGQYIASARIVAIDVGIWHAYRIAILSAAANLLPVPGAVVVRAASLSRAGTGLGKSFASSTAVGFSWLGMTGVVGGIFLLLDDELGTGLVYLAAGLVANIAYVAWVHRLTRTGDHGRSAILLGLGVGAGIAIVAGINQWLAFEALRADVSFSQSVAISAAGVLAATVGFFPGGLGLREVFAAGLAANVGVSAALGAVATALGRVVAMADLAIITVAVRIGGRGDQSLGLTDLRNTLSAEEGMTET